MGANSLNPATDLSSLYIIHFVGGMGQWSQWHCSSMVCDVVTVAGDETTAAWIKHRVCPLYRSVPHCEEEPEEENMTGNC